VLFIFTLKREYNACMIC